MIGFWHYLPLVTILYYSIIYFKFSLGREHSMSFCLSQQIMWKKFLFEKERFAQPVIKFSVFWNFKFVTNVYNSMPLVHDFSHMKLVCTLPPHLFITNFNITFPNTGRSFKWLFAFSVSVQNCNHFSYFSCTFHPIPFNQNLITQGDYKCQ